MDMGRERLTRGSLLCLGILLTSLCVCIHVYLETDWPEASASLALGHPTPPIDRWGEQTRRKQVSAETERQDGSTKRKISYVWTQRKNSAAGKRNGDRRDSTPFRPHRKVCLISHQPWTSNCCNQIYVSLSGRQSNTIRSFHSI